MFYGIDIVGFVASNDFARCFLVHLLFPLLHLQPLEFEGYVNAPIEGVSEDEGVWDGSVSSGQQPQFPTTQLHHSAHGHVLGRSAHQIFTATESVLEMGMCGGVVSDVSGL